MLAFGCVRGAGAENGMSRVRDFIVACIIGVTLLSAPDARAQQNSAQQNSAQQNSGAIGQIVPRGGVIALTGEPGAIVSSIHVRTGDAVKAGDLLMTLQGDILKAEQDLARSDWQGAAKIKESQLAAQNLAVELSKQHLQEATRQLTTYKSLGDRAVSANEVARLEAQETQARLSLQIEQAKQQTVGSEADKSVQAAAKRLALANGAMEIRAPSDGTILKIDRRAGQRLAADSAIQMGDLSTMYVSCQVYEGDLLRLKPGMKATVKSATLATPITGTVEEIGRIVDTRSRLGEVRIKLDSAEPANRLVGMEVEVVIAR
jgi:HlyD family secretion protein